MIADIIVQDTALLNDFFWRRYGDYLEKMGGVAYRQKVLDYVAKEDSPRSLNFQFDLMKKVGFSKTEILHKMVALQPMVELNSGHKKYHQQPQQAIKGVAKCALNLTF